MISLSLVTSSAFAAFPVKTVNQPYYTQHISVATDTNVLSGQITPPRKQRKDVNGTLSLVFGAIGLLSLGLSVGFSIVAIAIGNKGIKRKEKYAKTGFILGILGLAIAIAEIVVAIIIILLSLGMI